MRASPPQERSVIRLLMVTVSGVEPALIPGVTAQDALDCERRAAPTVAGDRLVGITRAGWMEATPRAEQRRERPLIEKDQESEGGDAPPMETASRRDRSWRTSASTSAALAPIIRRDAMKMTATPRHDSSFLLRR